MVVSALTVVGTVAAAAAVRKVERDCNAQGRPGGSSGLVVADDENRVSEHAPRLSRHMSTSTRTASPHGSSPDFMTSGPSAATFDTGVDASREPLKYVLRLSGMETLSEGYTVYYIRVAVESHSLALQREDTSGSTLSSSPAKRMWFIRKRYRDFHNMHAGIMAAEGSAPGIPVKQYFGNCEPEFLKQRAHGLSTFLWELAHNAHLTGLRCVHDFLWSDVCVPPAMTMLPNTPMLDSRRSSIDISELSLDDDQEGARTRNNRRDTVVKDEHVEIIDRASSDIKEAQGQLLLTSTADLQRSFAKEGIAFVQEDVIESDDEDEGSDGRYGAYYLKKACGGFLPGVYQWYSGEDTAGGGHGGYCGVAERGTSGTRSGRSPRVALVRPNSLPDEQVPGSEVDLKRVHEKQEMKFRQATVEQDDELRRQLVPRLRFVILLVGSRGDVQPYVALGMALQRRGHYVRVAAHECFRDFVNKYGLGFAPLAGDPHELLRMVTENSMFSVKFVKEGVATQRTWVGHVLDDAWDACTLPDDELRQGPESEPRAEREHTTRNVGNGPGFAFAARGSAFRADAIIANPPSFSGWHIAEALGVPLFMSFPMPWSRTTAFPSPFTNAGGSPSAQLNWMSYGAVDRLIWLGTGDLVNRWRVKTLRLQPIWTFSARGHRILHDSKVPFIYPWSSQVLAKPRDWGAHISVPGYWFLDDEVAATKRQERERSETKDQRGEEQCEDGGAEDQEENAFEPDPELAAFLAAGSAPVFIGFGSIVVVDQEKLSKTVVGAVVALAPKHRFIVQAGWSNLDISGIPATLSHRVMALGPCPHRWLFAQCKAVVHHGGAGTTAEAMRAGKPSIVVPFFGDQFFWARRIPEVRVGTSVPDLSVKNLCKAIEGALGVGSRMRAQVLGKTISREKGTEVAIAFIERQFLQYEKIHSVDPEHEGEIEINGSAYEGSEHWRKWPFIDWADRSSKKKSGKLSSISRRVKVVGDAAFKTMSVSQKNVLESPQPGVELKALSKKSSKNTRSVQSSLAAKVSPSLPSSAEPAYRLPPGHTSFTWMASSSTRTPVGHTRYSFLQETPL